MADESFHRRDLSMHFPGQRPGDANTSLPLFLGLHWSSFTPCLVGPPRMHLAAAPLHGKVQQQLQSLGDPE